MKSKFLIFFAVLFGCCLAGLARAESVVLVPDVSKYEIGYPEGLLLDVNDFYIPLSDANDVDTDYVYFNGKIYGPSRGAEPFFSDDRKTVLLKSRYDNELLRNNEKYSLPDDKSFNFNKQSGKVAYLDYDASGNNYLMINGQKIMPILSYADQGLRDFNTIFKFSNDGQSYALINGLTNPDYAIQFKKITDEHEAKYSVLMDGKYSNYDNLDETAYAAIQTKMNAENEDYYAKVKALQASFKDNWIHKDQLVVNGTIQDEYEKIYGLFFTPDNKLWILRLKEGKVYLTSSNKDIYVDDYSDSKDYYGFKVSPDGKHFAVVVKIVAPIVESADYQTTLPTYQVIIDGKKSEIYKKLPQDYYNAYDKLVAFSSDWQHYSYAASIDGSKWFIIYDGVKSESLDKVGDYDTGIIRAASVSDKSYYIAQQGKNACVYINNKKEICPSGGVTPTLSWVYLLVSNDGKNMAYKTGDGYIVLNGQKFGPYEKLHDFILSPDGKKVAYDTENGQLYLNGKLLSEHGEINGHNTKKAWFTSDSRLLYMTPKYTKEGDMIAVMDEDGKEVLIYDTYDQFFGDPNYYDAEPNKDGTTLWRLYTKGNTLFQETMNINLKNSSVNNNANVGSGKDSKSINRAVSAAKPSSLANKLKGKILLQVEGRGEAWYVYPGDLNKYYLKDGATAYEALRKFGVGIKNADLSKIPVGQESRFSMIDVDNDGLPDKLEEALGTDPTKMDSDGDGYSDGDEIKNGYNPLGDGKIDIDSVFASKQEGRILLQVEGRGEAWYIHNNKRYYLANGDAAYQIMKFLSLGVSNKDLDSITAGSL